MDMQLNITLKSLETRYLDISINPGEGKATFIERHPPLGRFDDSWIHQDDFLSLAAFSDRIKDHQLNIDPDLRS